MKFNVILLKIKYVTWISNVEYLNIHGMRREVHHHPRRRQPHQPPPLLLFLAHLWAFSSAAFRNFLEHHSQLLYLISFSGWMDSICFNSAVCLMYVIWQNGHLVLTTVSRSSSSSSRWISRTTTFFWGRRVPLVDGCWLSNQSKSASRAVHFCPVDAETGCTVATFGVLIPNGELIELFGLLPICSDCPRINIRALPSMLRNLCPMVSICWTDALPEAHFVICATHSEHNSFNASPSL